MTKSADLVFEIIRNNKPALRPLGDRPQKSQKHRYERRRVREYLRLTDWLEEA